MRPPLQGAAQAALFAYMMQAADVDGSYRNMTVYTLGMPQVGEDTCSPPVGGGCVSYKFKVVAVMLVSHAFQHCSEAMCHVSALR